MEIKAKSRQYPKSVTFRNTFPKWNWKGQRGRGSTASRRPPWTEIADRGELNRDQRLRNIRTQPLEVDEEERHGLSVDQMLAAPEEQTDLRIDLVRLWGEIPAELRELWVLLFDEGGNVSAVAKRLGRPRKTLDYWISKLRRFLKSRGI